MQRKNRGVKMSTLAVNPTSKIIENSACPLFSLSDPSQLAGTNLRQIMLQSSGITPSEHPDILAVYTNGPTLQKAHLVFLGMENHQNLPRNRRIWDFINIYVPPGATILREGEECMEPATPEFSLIRDPKKRPANGCGCLLRFLRGKPIKEYGWDSVSHFNAIGYDQLQKRIDELAERKKTIDQAFAAYQEKRSCLEERNNQRTENSSPRPYEEIAEDIRKLMSLNTELEVIEKSAKQYSEDSLSLEHHLKSATEGELFEGRQKSLRRALRLTKATGQVWVVAGNAHFESSILQEFSNNSPLMYIVFKP